VFHLGIKPGNQRESAGFGFELIFSLFKYGRERGSFEYGGRERGWIRGWGRTRHGLERSHSKCKSDFEFDHWSEIIP